jgi:hypothetical protein
MKKLVRALVEEALRKSDEDLWVIRTQESLAGALESPPHSISLLWLDIPEPVEMRKDKRGNMAPQPRKVAGEAVYAFWQLWKAGILTGDAYVIFTDIQGDATVWRDLTDYESCKFGSIFLLNYDSTTSPAVKPSQRGMLVK